jgi:hypothetical protein
LCCQNVSVEAVTTGMLIPVLKNNISVLLYKNIILKWMCDSFTLFVAVGEGIFQPRYSICFYVL